MSFPAAIVTFFLLSTSPPLFGDGMPFNEKTQEVYKDSIRFRLSKEQFAQIVKTGRINLSEPQHALLKRFYPNAVREFSPIWPTYNDNCEGLTDEDIYVLWTRPDELAVTVNSEVLSSAELTGNALADKAEKDPNIDSTLLIPPTGAMHLAGEAISLEGVFKAIDNGKIIGFKIPPQYSKGFYWPEDQEGAIHSPETLAKRVSQLVTTITQYAKANRKELNYSM